MKAPENYYIKRYSNLLIVGVHGDAPHIKRCLDKYKIEGRFKDLDESPILHNSASDRSLFNCAYLNLYQPDVFTFQIGQNIGHDYLLYTSLVCTGIGNSTLDVVVDFAKVTSFRSRKLNDPFKLSLRDQDPFKSMYDVALSFGLDPKLLFAVSLKEQQKKYRK